MAVFNPDFPDIEPKFYGGLSRPIESVAANTSLGEALKDTGEVFSSAVKVAHTLTQNDLHDQILASIDAERTKATTALQAKYDAFRSGQPNATATGVDNKAVGIDPTDMPSSLFQKNGTQDLPADLRGFQQKVDDLDSAKASGQYSTTFLAAKYDQIVTDYRARFPGWRDYIDEVVHKSTGEIPANAKITGLIHDLNTYVTSQQHDRNKIFTEVVDAAAKGAPGMDKWAAGLMAGHVNPADALTALTSSKVQDYLRDQRMKDIAYAEANRGYQKTLAEDVATNWVSQHATDAVAATYAASGMTDKNLPDFKGTGKAEQALQLAQNFSQDKLKAQTFLESKMKAPYKDSQGNIVTDAKGNPVILWDLLGADKSNKLIADGLKIYDTHIEALAGKNPDLSPGNFVTMINKAKVDQMTNNLFKDPKAGATFLIANSLQHILGPNALPSLYETIGGLDIQGSARSVIQSNLAQAAAGTPNPDGSLPSITDDARRLQEKGVMNNPKAFTSQVDWLTAQIKNNPNAELKGNLIRYMFDPQAYGLIGRLEKAGQYSMYGRLTDPTFAKPILALGGDSAKMYTDWAKHTFGEELLSPSVGELNGIQLPKDSTLHYNNETNSFSVIDHNGRDLLLSKLRMGSPVLDPIAQKSLNNINYGLQRLKPIAEASGTDVNAYLTGYLVDLGLRNSNVIGLPKDIATAIISANKNMDEEKKRQEQLNKDYPKP